MNRAFESRRFETWRGLLSHPGREAEEFEEAEVVSGGQQFAVFGERGGVNEAERWPYPLTGGTENGRPARPFQLLELKQKHGMTSAVQSKRLTRAVGALLTSATLMFCLRPRGASKNSCSLAPVFTCSSLPVEVAHESLTPPHRHVKLQPAISGKCVLKVALVTAAQVSLTSGVPVDVSDVASGSFADADSLAGQDVVDVHKRVVRGHSQVLPRI